MTAAQELLPSWDDRLDWNREVGPIQAREVLRGSPETDFVVVLATADQPPANGDMKRLWKERAQGSASPILVVAEYPGTDGTSVALLGPFEDDVPIRGIDRNVVEQLVLDGLRSTSAVALVKDLRGRLTTLETGVAAGLRNEGLFASHVLELQPSEQSNWAALLEVGAKARRFRGHELLSELGYQVEHVPDGEVLLERGSSHRRAAALVLREGESFDNPLNRLNNATAVAHGLLLAEREGLPWLVLMGGSSVRLYPVSPDIGVGRKGQTQTFLELDLALLPDDKVGFLPLLFGPDGLRPDGSVVDLLTQSADFAAELATRLRERIYEGVIPTLAQAVAAKMQVTSASAADQRKQLDEAYHRAMIVLFRLLFVAYAEDRRLLPYGVSERYTRNALKTLAKDLAERPSGDFDANSTTLWDDLVQVWRVIDTGDIRDWGVPAYNGGLFTRDADKNPSGAATYSLELTNEVIGPVLTKLLVDETVDGVIGPVDFRSLSVREFGTIYEGLLESGLDVATIDLSLGSDDMYVPASDPESAEVKAGEVYFHSLSGSRKATGSYFTKPFAVEHLLDEALEPALSQHLERIKGHLQAGRNKVAAREFFDFRAADLSMGSGHFLIAAIDRIEARFSRFLAEHPMPEVAEEIATLRDVAARQLGLTPDEAGIDDGILLRRQIARRCIYGADINEIAVELARLAIWIHTFVPGLPLSFLNHGLVWGNSLTGVGTLKEIETALEEAEHREHGVSAEQLSMFLPSAISSFLERASTQLDQLGALSDASIADVGKAVQVEAELAVALEPLCDLCDLITAERATRGLKKSDPGRVRLTEGGSAIAVADSADALEAAVQGHPMIQTARAIGREVQALHMPVEFPEVFRRERPGFDVILGNPPWEKLHVNSEVWWGVKSPGLRSLPQGKKLKAIAALEASRPDLAAELTKDTERVKTMSAVIANGPYPGIGEAHLDLFSAFSWRFWQEVRDGGRVGVVLPRAAMSGAALAQWRRAVLEDGAITDLTSLVNNRGWAFDGVHPQWTIALLAVSKGTKDHEVVLRGPFSGMNAYRQGMAEGVSARAVIQATRIFEWSDTAAIPLMPPALIDVFATMRAHPDLGAALSGWSFRPVQGDFNETNDKPWLDFSEPPKLDTPVWSGRAFNLWDAGSGDVYAHADSKVVLPELFERRLRAGNNKRSAYYQLPSKYLEDRNSLAPLGPRIVFRDVCRATDSRTMICALAPGGVFLTTKAPWLLRQSGTPKDEAFLLGVLSSVPFDWFTRRFVELKMAFELLKTFPVPRLDPSSGQALSTDGTAMSTSLDLRPLRDRVIEISGLLAAADDRFAEWAKAVGVTVGSVKSEAQREDLIAELDAVVSLLYGLTEEHLKTVFSSFHRGWDHSSRLKAVEAHYAKWKEVINK